MLKNIQIAPYRHAAVGEIAKLVHVKGVLAGGQTRDLASDL